MTLELTHPTRAIIDLAAFRQNLDVVRSYVGEKVRILAVVKANAYGHGVKRITGEAVRYGIDYLGVARAPEAFELRMMGTTQRILVFEVVMQEHLQSCIEQDLDLTVVSLEGAQRLNGIAERLRKKARVHVKVDTGMSRLGFPFRNAASGIEAIARLSSIELAGAYSHFATSEDPDQSFANEQLNRFQSVLAEIERKRIEIPLRHMANSGAIMTLPSAHFDMVRPGIMLYGYPPGNGMTMRWQLAPVMSLVSKVAFLKTVDENTSVSYGRRYSTSSKTAIATVPIGYADGYSRLLTNKGEALIRGKRYPVVGTVCMDQVMLDVGTTSEVEEGDEVTFIGRDGKESITGWDVAAKVGSIPYEVTCLITPRVARVYKH